MTGLNLSRSWGSDCVSVGFAFKLKTWISRKKSAGSTFPAGLGAKIGGELLRVFFKVDSKLFPAFLIGKH